MKTSPVGRSVLFLVVALATTLIAATSLAQNVRHVSGKLPVEGNSREMSVERPQVPSAPVGNIVVRPSANPWKLLATLPGAIIHDMAFPTRKIGYAVGEAGQVWKTTNAGVSWTEILNANYPYYWYGITAFSSTDLVISGIYDSSTFYGLIRWSHDGGQTWTNDIQVTPTGFVQRVRFANSNDGLIMDLDDGANNSAYYTTDGGAEATDWTTVDDNPTGGWFGLEFSLLSNLHARASGINYCTSLDGGADWSCGPSIDSVFDGPVFFYNDNDGWVGGGEISPSVEGWLHRTTDGGNTWSGRTLNSPWPIREIFFLTPKIGWATGGNVYTNVGGIYFSSDGGESWSLDVNTGNEMDACAGGRAGTSGQIWCAGYNFNGSSFNSVIYTLRGSLP
jgi:photosystem II stability/assembly factor-like uncharacterized protein